MDPEISPEGDSMAKEGHGNVGDRRADTGKFLSVLLLDRYRKVVEAKSSLEQRPGDPETLHDFRTSVRKLRALIKFLGPLVSGSGKSLNPLRQELKSCFRFLGEIREWDVLRADWDRLRPSLPGPWKEEAFPFGATGDRRRDLPDTLLLPALAASFEEVRCSFERGLLEPVRSIGSFARKRLGRWDERIVEGGRMWDSLDLSGRHRLRIDVKNLSGVFGIVRVLWPHGVDPEFPRALKTMRSLLGEIHDRDRAFALLSPFLDSPRQRLSVPAGVLLGWYASLGQDREERFRKVRDRYRKLRCPWRS